MRGPEGTHELNERYGGLCKPDITFFGEALPRRFGQLAPVDFDECYLLIIMGTSLKVRLLASPSGSLNNRCHALCSRGVTLLLRCCYIAGPTFRVSHQLPQPRHAAPAHQPRAAADVRFRPELQVKQRCLLPGGLR